MKKFALLFITLLVLSCSKDESVNTTDPIIGSWDFDEPLIYSDDEQYQITVIFNEDGTGTEKYTLLTPREDATYYIDGSDIFTWENTASNPDFDSVNQSYIVIYPEELSPEPYPFSVNFSSDFNSFTFNNEDGDFETVTRN